MVETTLAVAAVSTHVVALTYLYVGVRIARRARSEESLARPMTTFAVWWITTSANQFLGATLYFAAAFGFTDVSLQLAYVVVQRLLLSISLVGLMHYLIFLQTGKDRLLPLLFVYGLYYVASIYTVVARGPIAVESFGWRTDLAFRAEISPLWDLLSLAIVVPPVVGALMLLRVYRRVEGRTRRFRIAMLAGGFALWWITAIFAGQPSTYDVAALQMANRVVGLVVALGVLVAYEPRPWMVRSFGFERQALS